MNKRRFLIIIMVLFLLSGIAPAQAAEPQKGTLPFYWVTGKVTKDGQPVIGRTVAFYTNWESGIRITTKTDGDGNYKINIYELYYYHNVPIAFGENDLYKIAVVRTKDNNYGVEETFALDINQGHMQKDLKVVEGGGPIGEFGPVLNITMVIQGYYFDFVNKEQRDATILVEARTGDNPENAKASNIVGEAEIKLKSDGSGTNNGNWIIAPPNNEYYLVVKHKLPNITAGPNHLPIISSKKVALSLGQPKTVNFSDEGDQFFLNAYTPMGNFPTAMVDAGGRKALRGGDADGNGLIQAADVSLWFPDINKEGIYIGDYDGNKIVQAADQSVWFSNLNVESYVPKD